MPRKSTKKRQPKATAEPKSAVAADHPYRDKSRGIRLQKFMADAGVASRRDCESYIEAGRVTINNDRLTELPLWIDPEHDHVEFDGDPVRPRKQPKRGTSYTYLMLHKPKRVVSTVSDEPDRRGTRKTVLDLIDPAVTRNKRLYPVGRLDAESTGLLLLTDDGDLAHKLTHPSFEIRKRYDVTVKGRVTEEALAKLKKGMKLATPRGGSGGPTKGRYGKADQQQQSDKKTETDAGRKSLRVKHAKVTAVSILGVHKDVTRGDTTVLGITLEEGQNREIRRLLARLGFDVKRLKRTSIGPLQLRKLAPGQWRPLTPTELAKLRKAAK